MSKEILTAVSNSCELATYATPELRGLFNDWLGEIELLIAEFVNRRNRVDPRELASHFKLTTESVIFILGKLARDGKIIMEAKCKVAGNLRVLKE